MKSSTAAALEDVRSRTRAALSPKSSHHQALAPSEKKPGDQTIQSESPGTAKHLRCSPESTVAPSSRRRSGWTPKRRARQAALIRRWAPWRRSTGPRTEAGKARCAMNALKHGFRSRASLDQLRRVRHALGLAARNIAWLNLLVRIRRLLIRLRRVSARPRIKYKTRPQIRCRIAIARRQARMLRQASLRIDACSG